MAILSDTSSALYRSLHMNKTEVCQNPEFISHLILTMMLNQANTFGASKENPFIITMDSPSWRKDFYAEHCKKLPGLENLTYKGNRVKDPAIPWEAIFSIYDDVMETLKKHSDFYVMKVAKAEADDIIAVLAKYFKAKGEVVFVLSGDKDFQQLVDAPTVNLYDPMKKAFRPTINVNEFKKLHIMMGDKIDNILPIRSGIGEKTAIKMLPEIDILLQTNFDMRQRYEFNKNLIDFDCIPEDIARNIITEFETQEHTYNASKLLTTFVKYKLAKHAENINKFKLGTQPVKTKLNSHFTDLAKNQAITNSNLTEFFA